MRSYSAYGVRNSFGLAIDPVTGNLWDTENGPGSYDEVNLVAPGFNSGWETIMGPDARDPQSAGDLFQIPGAIYADPEFSWPTPVAPTAILFPVGSALGPAYDDVALVADNNTGSISRFTLNAQRNGFVLSGALADLVADDATEAAQVRLGTSFGSSTDLELGPDGNVYVVSIARGTVYRIRPVASPTPTSPSSPTPTRTPTRTPTQTPTATPTRTPTAAPPATPTSPPPTATNPPPPTPTRTATPIPTATRTATPGPTATRTATPVPSTMHVGDLDRSSANLGKNWQATVSIAVHGSAHAPISGATVSGAWSGPVSGSSSCTTAASGVCSVTEPDGAEEERLGHVHGERSERDRAARTCRAPITIRTATATGPR